MAASKAKTTAPNTSTQMRWTVAWIGWQPETNGLVFGPDGDLYIGLGDGGSGGFALEPMSVAAFYSRLMRELGRRLKRLYAIPLFLDGVDSSPCTVVAETY